MPTVFIAIARVRDWKAIQRLNDEELLTHMRKVGATRYRLHRNLEDASQMLVIIEVPYLDDLGEWTTQFNARFWEDVLESSVWEMVIGGEIE